MPSKTCNPKAKKASVPGHVCNKTTGQWNKLPVICAELERENEKLRTALAASKEAYDVLARKNANNVLRNGLTLMFWRRCRKELAGRISAKRSKSLTRESMASPALSCISSAASINFAPNSRSTPAMVRKIVNADESSPSLATLLNEAIMSPIYTRKANQLRRDNKRKKIHDDMAREKKTPSPKSSTKKSVTPLLRDDLRNISAFSDLSYRTDKALYNEAILGLTPGRRRGSVASRRNLNALFDSAISSRSSQRSSSDMDLDSTFDEVEPLDISANYSDLVEEELVAAPDNSFQLSPNASVVDLVDQMRSLSVSAYTTDADDTVSLEMEGGIAQFLDNAW